MAHCVPSGPTSKVQAPGSIPPSQVSVDQSMRPVLFEIFGEIWTVQSRLGQGVSASVYQVSSGRAATAAVKEFQADSQGGDYGYHKERTVLEDIQGHKNIGKNHYLTSSACLIAEMTYLLVCLMLHMSSCLSVTLYGVFTNHNCVGVATRCLLLELLDVSVSDLLVTRSSGVKGGR
ncbi:hypothetical protein XENOCAPTIV_021239 [Xenoophorus captivus]|uniref:Uncharacterized protein n=1 Tax=Xenoophorus captivus TaxID=1517983 RepID=A0ABV0RM03_9TELE